MHYTGVDTNAVVSTVASDAPCEFRREVCSHLFTDEEKQTQRGEVMSPGSHSELMLLEPELELYFQLQALVSLLLHEHSLFNNVTWVPDHTD